MDKKTSPVDTANEPVDHADQDDADFMDTGILHEKKTESGK